MMWADTTLGRSLAAPGTSGWCPACTAPVIPKCGQIITWHWAHVANDCDPWSEPETQWHLDWKHNAAATEVVMKRGGVIHRADIVAPNGWVVELQSNYLAPDLIAARERFYGRRMVWLYNASRWLERLHFGRKGFWWKHGAKSLAIHRRPVYWHLPESGMVWRVSVSVVDRLEEGSIVGHRVLGKRIAVESENTFKAWLVA